jgi:hypothetical protein
MSSTLMGRIVRNRPARTVAETRFGREHDFRRVRSVSDYRDRVPPRSDEAFWTEYWQRDFPRIDDIT